MNQREIDELETCIQILTEGGTIEDCLRLFPLLSTEAQANLAIAFETMKLGETSIPTDSIEKSRTRLLEQAGLYRSGLEDQKLGKDSWLSKIQHIFLNRPSFWQLAGRVVMILGITTLLIIFSRGLMVTSAKSLPGDSLYPVKRAVEDIQVYLTVNQKNKLEYEEDINQERVGEVVSLLDLKRIQQVSFEGTLEEVDHSQWLVSGVPVTIQPNTVLLDGLTGSGEFPIGSAIEVEGSTNSAGGVDANEIHLREYQLVGSVEKIDQAAWQIAGYKIPINSGTKIEAEIQVGDEVVVLLHSEDNGLFAVSIQRLGQVTPAPIYEQPSHLTAGQHDDATEVQDAEQHDPEPAGISPELTQIPEQHDQDDMYTTTSPTSEDSHISTPVPEITDEPEHEGGSTTPEIHETPEPTDTHEGEP